MIENSSWLVVVIIMLGLPSLVSSVGSHTYFICWGCSVCAVDDLWIIKKLEVDKEQHETSLLLSMREYSLKLCINQIIVEWMYLPSLITSHHLLCFNLLKVFLAKNASFSCIQIFCTSHPQEYYGILNFAENVSTVDFFWEV